MANDDDNKVVALNKRASAGHVELRSLPSDLRLLADRIESGEISATKMLTAYITHGGHVQFCALGDETISKLEAMGMCQWVANALQVAE